MKRLINVLLILLCMGVVSGCSSLEKIDETDENYPIISPFVGEYGESTKIYFPKNNENKLGFEDRIIENRNKSYEEMVLDEILEGPKSIEFREILPNGLEVLSVDVIGQIAYLNFNDDFIKNAYSEEEEILLVYSIVNTMAELDKITRVQFLVNGDRAEFVNNYIQLTEPLDSSDFIEKVDAQTPAMAIRQYYRKYQDGEDVSEYYSNADQKIGNWISRKKMKSMDIKSVTYNKYGARMSIKVELKNKEDETIIQNIKLLYEDGKGFEIIGIEK